MVIRRRGPADLLYPRMADTVPSSRCDAHESAPATQDELAALAVTMNDLLDRLRAALERERGFVADRSHPVGTRRASFANKKGGS